MAVRDVFKVTRMTFFNPAAWLDIDGLIQQTVRLKETLKLFYSFEKVERTETFEEAVARQQLTDADLENSRHSYQRTTYLFIFFAIVMLLYAFYLLFRYKTITGWLLALGASIVFVSQAYKYDFWAFQIRERKLGLSFQDWKRSTFGW